MYMTYDNLNGEGNTNFEAGRTHGQYDSLRALSSFSAQLSGTASRDMQKFLDTLLGNDRYDRQIRPDASVGKYLSQFVA
jgi:hypothetical protein